MSTDLKNVKLRSVILAAIAAACAFGASHPGLAQINHNTTDQEGFENRNESNQRGRYNDNEAYQSGRYNENRSGQVTDPYVRRNYRRDRRLLESPRFSGPREWNAQRRYRYGEYRPPSGWRYHRWHYGDRLPNYLWDREFWIMDSLSLGLTPPAPGYIWVRYGKDALLISSFDGEIVEVAYGIFY